VPCENRTATRQEHGKDTVGVCVCVRYTNVVMGRQDPWHIGFYVAKTDGSGYRVLAVAPEELVAKATFSNTREVSTSVHFVDPSVPLVVIPCTFKPQQECDFRMSFETTEASLSVAPVDAKLEYRMYTQEGKWEGSTAGGCKNHPR
jgi:hypothetical protein